MGKFKLVNPVIIGTFNDTYESSFVDDAAKKFWETLTTDNKYITGNIPKFLFTLMDMSNEKLHHYLVKEKPEGSHADYSIVKINVELTSDQKKEFLKEVNKVRSSSEKMMNDKQIEQSGGKRKRYNDVNDDNDDSSSTDSDSDIDDLFKYIKLKRAIRPIVYWWYTPVIYKIDTIFTPTFVAPISPYVQLWLPII